MCILKRIIIKTTESLSYLFWIMHPTILLGALSKRDIIALFFHFFVCYVFTLHIWNLVNFQDKFPIIDNYVKIHRQNFISFWAIFFKEVKSLCFEFESLEKLFKPESDWSFSTRCRKTWALFSLTFVHSSIRVTD